MFRIGDFSRLSFVTVKTLRYYDEIGLLKPARVDRFTGYRYYSSSQLSRLNYIVALKEMGLSLEEIRTVLDSGLGELQRKELFLLKQAELRRRVGEEQRRLEQVEKLLVQLEQGLTMDYQFTMKPLEEIKIASVRGTVPAYGDIGMLIEKLYPQLQSAMHYVCGPFIAIYHDMEYVEKNVDIEAALPVSQDFPVTPPVTIRTLPAVPVAVSTTHKGSYDDIHNAYTALMGWCEANGYELDGPDREVYLVGPDKTQNPVEYVTELQQPVRKNTGH